MKTKPLIVVIIILFILTVALIASKDHILIDDESTVITMWHVYGEQSESPMDKLIDEFNHSVGKDNNIIINVTALSNASQIGKRLVEANELSPIVDRMPDLFFCHKSDALLLGVENVVDWNEYFTKEELSAFVPDFLTAGTHDDKLCVFPTTKSTHLLFVSELEFERFSKATGASFDDLKTWEGFYSTAEKYYEWSGGKTFCCIDYPMRLIELNAIENGAGEIFTPNGDYDYSNTVFKEAFLRFMTHLAKGHIALSDLFSNTQMMTGECVAGISSSAAILYYNDTVTYSDGKTEPLILNVMSPPTDNSETTFITTAGVGLCMYKTTEKKAQAAKIFIQWLTEPNRNLEFVNKTGYMPVTKEAFDKLSVDDSVSPNYKALNKALIDTYENSVSLSENDKPIYYSTINSFYSYLRTNKKSIVNNNDAQQTALMLWDYISNLADQNT